MNDCINEGEMVIEEIMFFATGTVDFFIALASDSARVCRMAGRLEIKNGDGCSLILLSSAAPRDELREKMKEMANEYAATYDGEYTHLIFTDGMATREFMARLREPRYDETSAWFSTWLPKHKTLN